VFAAVLMSGVLATSAGAADTTALVTDEAAAVLEQAGLLTFLWEDYTQGSIYASADAFLAESGVPIHGVSDPNGGSGSSVDRRDCTGIQWNDGTRAGTYGQPTSICLGGLGAQRMVGSSTHDGNDYADAISGREGADSLWGGRGHDRLFGDYANGDRSTDGADGLHGGTGNDKLFGGRGADYIAGNAGADELYARDGYRDHVTCADSVDQARQEAASGNWVYEYGVAGTRDYVEADQYDVISDTCKYAKVVIA
jgi:Ca2+-binding RTX toxin-like protein